MVNVNLDYLEYNLFCYLNTPSIYIFLFSIWIWMHFQHGKVVTRDAKYKKLQQRIFYKYFSGYFLNNEVLDNFSSRYFRGDNVIKRLFYHLEKYKSLHGCSVSV